MSEISIQTANVLHFAHSIIIRMEDNKKSYSNKRGRSQHVQGLWLFVELFDNMKPSHKNLYTAFVSEYEKKFLSLST